MAMRRLLTILGILLMAAATARTQPPTEWDDQAVAKSIEAAKKYLWGRWLPEEGHWPEPRPGLPDTRSVNYGGQTALCLYALLAAGENPGDERVAKTLQWLARTPMRGTYAVAFRANVWAMLGANSKYRKNLARDIRYLVTGINNAGAYSYVPLSGMGGSWQTPPVMKRYDNSNSQLAVLGVWAGVLSRIEVDKRYWQMVERHWKDDQFPDGGWGYSDTGASYGSMSAAGLATMFICYDMLHADKLVRCEAAPRYEPIANGLAWLEKNFSATDNPRKGVSWYYYYLYCVERVGLASGYRYFGPHDWYKLGAQALVRQQHGNGAWIGLTRTSFALLFLARGRHPVLFNKLKYDGTWNTRPRDLANLTRWISRNFEKTVNWQIIHLGTPVADWHDAPILFISGATAPKFTAQQIAKLRKFVLQGGVILSESACSRAAFNMGMRRAYARMFPEYELKKLSGDHPVYTVHYQVRRGQSLWGISNGVRLLAIHSPKELSLPWQANRYATQPQAFRLGANIYFFVTNKGSLRRRGVSPWPVAKKFTPAETVKVAIVKHGGNFQPEPLAWTRFAVLMGNRYGVKVEVAEPTPPERLSATDWPVAAMTGTGTLTLTDAQLQALRRYVEAGGTLVVDAAGGSKAFADSAEKVLRELLPGSQEGAIAASHPLFTRVGAPIEKLSYRMATGRVRTLTEPRLRTIIHQGRLAIIFSREDLTAGLLGYPCWGLSGYVPESAFELMRNIVLYASGRTLPAQPG